MTVSGRELREMIDDYIASVRVFHCACGAAGDCYQAGGHGYVTADCPHNHFYPVLNRAEASRVVLDRLARAEVEASRSSG